MAEVKRPKLPTKEDVRSDGLTVPSVDTQSFLDQEMDALPEPLEISSLSVPANDGLTLDQSALNDFDLVADPKTGGVEAAELALSEAFDLSTPSHKIPEPESDEGVEVLDLSLSPEEALGELNIKSNEAETVEGTIAGDLKFEIPKDTAVDLAFNPGTSDFKEEPDLAFKIDESPIAEGTKIQEIALSPSTPNESEENSMRALSSSTNWGTQLAEPSPKSPEDLSVLKRYSSLKEREAREKEATVQVLRKQMDQLESRYRKSEEERRRLTLKLQEVESTSRAFQEGREQDRHHLSKLGEQHQEELRALQLRLDNAQFQASKSEKKLEEFRERIRNDIQKIRVRERELANRLELQKRDAEALLAAKDERLLQQKRDIDRLEFEIETLQDRLLEETSRAEDRTQRLTRALQSLRLAEGLLTGIEEEVLPNAGDGEGEAA